MEHVQIAIPKYARVTRIGNGEEDELAVFIPDAIRLMKLKLLQPPPPPQQQQLSHAAGGGGGDGVSSSDLLSVSVPHHHDVNMAIFRLLKTVFAKSDALSKMAVELAAAESSLRKSKFIARIRRLHLSTVTLAERRETCLAMTPRLWSIAGHARAMKAEYEQLWVDFKLGRLIFGNGLVGFPASTSSADFDPERLAVHMEQYMARLGGEYELVELDASPQAEKKVKVAHPEDVAK